MSKAIIKSNSTPAVVAVEAKETPDDALEASDGPKYEEILAYIDHGSRNNVGVKDLGEETPCDVPVVKSASPKNNETTDHDQILNVTVVSPRKPPSAFHAAARHGASLLRKIEEKWIISTNLKSEEVEVSKRNLKKYKQQFENQKKKIEDYVDKVDKPKDSSTKSFDDTKNKRIKQMYELKKSYLDGLKKEQIKLKTLEAEYDGLMRENYELLCELAVEIQQFCVKTLANQHLVPVFVLWNEKRRAILVYRPCPYRDWTATEEDSKEPYLLICLADGTKHLKTGEIITVIPQHFENLRKFLRTVKKDTYSWIDLSNKTVKDLFSCKESAGIYIMDDESSTRCQGLEELFPHWRIF